MSHGKLDVNAVYPLPAFDWKGSVYTEKQQEYFEYYGIHFSASIAGLNKHLFGVKNVAGYQIACHAFLLKKAKANVFLLHGYTDHVGLFNHVIEALLKDGFNVFCYDLPGHGLSSGEPAGIPDFADYQAVLCELLPEVQKKMKGQWLLLGQSTGGAIAMDYLLHAKEPAFKASCLLAPLVIPKDWASIKVKLHILRHFLQGVPREFEKNSHDEAFLRFLKNDDPLQSRSIRSTWVYSLYRWQKHFLNSPASDIPCCVIQGERDVTVDWRYNLKQIRRKFTVLQEVLLPRANHHLVKESSDIREQIFSEMLAFLNGHVSKPKRGRPKKQLAAEPEPKAQDASE